MNIFRKIKMFVIELSKLLEYQGEYIDNITELQALTGYTEGKCKAVIEILEERFTYTREEIFSYLKKYVIKGGDINKLLDVIVSKPKDHYRSLNSAIPLKYL